MKCNQLGREPGADLVEGWQRIARRLSDLTGFDISPDAAMRLAKRKHDPLPVRRWGDSRPRVQADGHELQAWCGRQWQSAQGKTS